MAKKDEVKDMVLTDEIKRKLFGMSISSKGIMFECSVPIEGVPEQFHPSFNLQTLTVSEVRDLKAQEYSVDTYSEITRKHIVGWKNLIDTSTGEFVDFIGDSGGCDKDIYDQFPDTLKIYLSNELIKLSIV